MFCFLCQQIQPRHKSFKEKEAETFYDAALKEMANEITEGIYQGKAHDVSKNIASTWRTKESKPKATANVQRLRLENHFGENIVFHQHPDKRKPQDVRNSVAAVTENARTRSESNISDDGPADCKNSAAGKEGYTEMQWHLIKY